MEPAHALERRAVHEDRRQRNEVLLEEPVRDGPLLRTMAAEVSPEQPAGTVDHPGIAVYERRAGFRPEAQLALELVRPPEIVGVREGQYVTMGQPGRKVARRPGGSAGRCLNHSDSIVVDRRDYLQAAVGRAHIHEQKLQGRFLSQDALDGATHKRHSVPAGHDHRDQRPARDQSNLTPRPPRARPPAPRARPTG